MYNTVLLAVALQRWDRYSTHALAARDLAPSSPEVPQGACMCSVPMITTICERPKFPLGWPRKSWMSTAVGQINSWSKKWPTLLHL